MSKLQQIQCNIVFVFLCFITIGLQAQKQTKTYNETFNVSENAVLDINTSHTDIQFETWNKDQVAIEVVIEIEGATDVEAKEYFENGIINIKGNSKKIEISTGTENSWLFRHSTGGLKDFDFHFDNDFHLHDILVDIPEMPNFPELMEMPPIPPMPIQNFDYEAYKKDGEEYLKKWKKEFDKGFDEKYKKRLEEWSKRMETKAMERKERMQEREKERAKRLEERNELLKKRVEEREEQHEKRLKLLHDRISSDSTRVMILNGDHNNNGPNIFFKSSADRAKKYKVKKTIKIKMPKSVKIQMNVRHGEVILAENTKNINATLSYASLLATTIDGDETIISASYSPVDIQKWNQGILKTDYSNPVSLVQVKNLNLNSISSDVTIGYLLDNVDLNGNFSDVNIKSVANNFNGLKVGLKNGEFNCKLPSSDYNVYITGKNSRIQYPTRLTMNVEGSNSKRFHSGYHKNKNKNRVIRINSDYSEVVLEK